MASTARPGGKERCTLHDAIERRGSTVVFADVRKGMAVRVVAVNRIENLSSEGEEEEDGGNDFAGAALGEPALDPGEDGAGKEKVEEDEQGEGEDGPEEEVGAGDADADGDGCGPDDADEGGRRGETVNNVEGNPRTEADGIAEEVAKFGILAAEGGREGGEELP